MTLEDVEQVVDIGRIHDKYVVSHPFDLQDSDTHGWVQATIVGFEIDEVDGELDCILEMPWGEQETYAFDENGIVGSSLSIVCKCYGYDLSEFQKLVGEDVWLKLRFVKSDDDGSIRSGTRWTYDLSREGPNYLKNRAKVVLGLVVLFIVLRAGFIVL